MINQRAIASVGTAAVSSAGTTGTSAAAGGSVLGKDDFLKLLVTQLRYQDPMNPMNGTEFASQLAQFSSVEQLQNINANLETSLSANAVMTQSINNALATTFVGKSVRAATSSFRYDGISASNLGYNLPAGAGSVTLRIKDSAGMVVRTITGGGTGVGDNTVKWDGKDDLGNQLAAGQYTVAVEAVDGKGASVTATTFIDGIVSGVRFKSDGTVFVIDGFEVPLSSVTQIGSQP